jgi:hypothetical protein
MPELGTLTFSLPNGSNINQDYLLGNDYDNNAYTGYTNFTGTTYFTAIGQSKISELKKYGSNTYQGVTVTNGVSGYTIDGISYMDYPDGFTIYTGNTSGYTQEAIINRTLTRNEHFLGFVEQPTVYSDIFVERGKQGVMEVNLRLGEIDNMGELELYGSGYFKIKKQ